MFGIKNLVLIIHVKLIKCRRIQICVCKLSMLNTLINLNYNICILSKFYIFIKVLKYLCIRWLNINGLKYILKQYQENRCNFM